MSSFRKRNVQKRIPGTRTSPHTGQVITSSGNPSLDVILGGGLPIGAICLIEEDKYVTHAKVLAKYFVAEGIVSTQDVFLGSLDDDPAEMLRKLPHPLTDEEIEQEKQTEAAETNDPNGLRIAWRYNDLPLVNSEQSTQKIGHHFNLLEPMDPVLFFYSKTTLWDDATNAPDIVVEDEDIVQDHFANGQQDTSTSTTTSSESSTSSSSITSDKDAETTSSSSGSSSDTKICATLATIDILSMHDDNDGTTAMIIDQVNQEQVTNQVNNNTNNGNMNTINDCNTTPANTPSIATNTAMLANDNGTVSATPSTSSTASHVTTTATVKTQTTLSSSSSSQLFTNSRYERLLKDVQKQLQEERYAIGMNTRKELCRVCITSLGSPLWYDENFPQDILKFLTVLRAAVRSVTAVCMITMPMHLIQKCDATLVPKIRNLVDYAIELDSFAGSERETHPVFKDYSGLLHLRKITAINTLTAYMPETTDLAFKLRRKKFVIEKLHLPPELQDAKDAEPNNDGIVSNSSTKAVSPPHKSLSCASNVNATLDF